LLKSNNEGLRIKDSIVLGIDFGTSNSSIAWARQIGSKKRSASAGNLAQYSSGLIKIENEAVAMPTALFFDAEENQVTFGRAALAAYRSGNDGRLMRSLKSLLGSDLMDESTEIFGKPTKYRDLITFYLAELKLRAEQQTGAKVAGVVMGRPVHFVDDDPERDEKAQSTLAEAAKLAGLKVLGFQFEPVAAALDFETTLSEDTQVLIADIGGGTSDFTLIELGPKRATKADRTKDVLSTGGIHIAGTDFDTAINLRHVMPLLGLGHIGLRDREVPRRIFFDLATWHRIHLAQSPRELTAARDLNDTYSDVQMHQRLLRVLSQRFGHQIAADVEQAKIEGSADPAAQVKIALDYIEPALKALATGQQMRETLGQSLADIGKCAQACVIQAGINPDQLPLIYLTGGSSALPAFQATLQACFPNARLVVGDLFSSVAAGLAQSAKWHAT
jgi:hypothetical chaperone protein